MPDVAVASIDRRLVPGEEPGVVLEELRDIAARAIAGIPGLSVEVDEVWPGAGAVLTNEHSPVVDAMLSANRTLGLPEELRGFSMATDGRFFSRQGIPTIIYGPGDPRLAHVPDEWIGIRRTVARYPRLHPRGAHAPDMTQGHSWRTPGVREQ